MVNYKHKESFLTNIKKGEIIFANHKLEFLKFFETHKNLCDQISGLKYHVINKIYGKEEIIITKENFIYGIKKLNSFKINYLHYILEEQKIKHINNKFDKLETKFLNDTTYQSYIKKSKKLTTTQETDFNKRYIEYLFNTFEIANLMSNYLQKSLNISSREVIKNIQYADYEGFFNSLSSYKEEMANDISNLALKTIFENFKKILGFFYTYRYLMLIREQTHILYLLKLIKDYIINETTIKIIIKLKDNISINNDLKIELNNEFKIIRNTFNTIYRLCNMSFSNKNILPKSKKEILIDTTLI